MKRLLCFVLVVVVIGVVSTMSKYQKFTVNNEKFNFQAEEQKYQAKQAEIEALKNPKPVEAVVEEREVEFQVVLDSPELENGHKKFASCVVCHGKMGEGKLSQKAPKIAGQQTWYIVSSLKAMKSGERVNQVMNAVLKNLSEKDFEDLALYLSKIPWSNK